MSDSYAAARVHAMRSRLIGAERYRMLMGMSPEEILGTLQSGDYGEDINALSIKDLDDLEAVDRMLAHNGKRLLRKIERMSGGEFANALDSYTQYNDLWNLRVILEALAGGHDPVDAMQRYGKHGTFGTADLERAGDILRYGRMLRERFGLKGDLSTAHAIGLALRELGATRPESRRMHAADAILIDHENIITIMLLKRDRVSPVGARKYLRPGGAIKPSVLRKALDAPDTQSALRALQGTRYGKAIRDAAPQDGDATYIRFEHVLRDDALRRIHAIAGVAPLHAETLIRYLVELEREHHNLRLLIKAKRLNLSAAFIEAHMMSDARTATKSAYTTEEAA